MDSLVQGIVSGVLLFADFLLPLMIVTFAGSVIMRVLIFYTISREDWFSQEFHKRVHNHLKEVRQQKDLSFYVTCKFLLEKTYYELFEIRAIMLRRKPDSVASLVDRMFLVQAGTARLVKDTLKQIRYLKYSGPQPKLLEIAKNVYETNPCFNKVFGKLPSAMFNDVLNIMPGIFIVGGIFGTFLGISKALPDLGNMDLNDIEGTKRIMDLFLLKISYAMSTSIIGIMLSVMMTFANTMMSADKNFVTIVNRFENSLDLLWNLCENNALPEDIADFDEHRDPIEALAEQALEKAAKQTEQDDADIVLPEDAGESDEQKISA